MTPRDLVLHQFPGRLQVTLTEAGRAIGNYEPQTCYNLHHAKKFPVPVRKVGKHNMVSLVDLIGYLEGKKVQEVLTTPEQPVAKLPKRRPGRPTKAEAAARRAAEQHH